MEDSRLLELYSILIDRFNEEELRTLSFQLGVDYDVVSGTGKAHKARELLLYLHRRGHIDKIVELGMKSRSDINWTRVGSSHQIDTDEKENLLIPFVEKWTQFCDFYTYFHSVVEASILNRPGYLITEMLKTTSEKEISLMQSWWHQIKELRKLLFQVGEESLIIATVHEWDELKDSDEYIKKRNYRSPFSYILDFSAPIHAVRDHGPSLWIACQISFRYLEYLSFQFEEIQLILDSDNYDNKLNTKD